MLDKPSQAARLSGICVAVATERYGFESCHGTFRMHGLYRVRTGGCV